MSKAGKVIAESLRRADGQPTMPDEDFEELVREFVASVQPRTEPYTLQELHKAVDQLRFGLFAIQPIIDKPYPDDPRWTPYTRFVKPRVEHIDHIVAALIAQEVKS